MPNYFPVSCDGMLGMPFMADSVIDLQTKTIKHKLGEFPFSTPPEKGTTLILNARTKQLVTLPVTDTYISAGYLPLVPAGPGVYLGECLASVKDGSIRDYCFNTNTRNVELSDSPVSLEKFEITKTISEFETEDNSKKKSEINPSNRFEKLVKELHLSNLNAHERESLLKNISKLGIFHLNSHFSQTFFHRNFEFLISLYVNFLINFFWMEINWDAPIRSFP